MKITIVTKEIIKKLSVHDGILGPITYNYEDKSCIFEVMNPGWNRHQTFHIKGILYMEVQQCEFAGPGPNIFCWYHDEKSTRTEELYRKKITEHYNSFSLLDERKTHHFEVVFLFGSEDEIRFICEEIEFHEYPYYKDEED